MAWGAFTDYERALRTKENSEDTRDALTLSLKQSINVQHKPQHAVSGDIIDIATRIAQDPASDFLYQYSPLCGVFFPYSDPKTDRWRAMDGKRHLLIRAGDVLTPSGEFVNMGIPYGPRPRVSLIQLNDYAIKQKTRFIDMDHSLRMFLRKMGLSADGRTGASFKSQMQRLVASDFTFAEVVSGNQTQQMHDRIVTSFSMWHENDEQRLIWPETVTLSESYYDNLTKHAVPLDLRAVRALQHSSIKLDIYNWLAMRMCRVKANRPQFIPWPRIREQFPLKGKGAMATYRQAFLRNLKDVLVVYPRAKVYAGRDGIRLQRSPPPVHRKPY